MNYTREHLKFVHNAGIEKFSFDNTLELISLLERNGLLHLLSRPGSAMKQKGRRKKRKIQKSAKTTGKAGKRQGDLSLMITGFLSTKGTTGAHVKEIARSIKAPLGSVTVWFYSTGKKYRKTGEIRKVAPATFAYFKPGKAD